MTQSKNYFKYEDMVQSLKTKVFLIEKRLNFFICQLLLLESAYCRHCFISKLKKCLQTVRYVTENVKGRIYPPDPVGTRGQYRFRETFLNQIGSKDTISPVLCSYFMLDNCNWLHVYSCTNRLILFNWTKLFSQYVLVYSELIKDL